VRREELSKGGVSVISVGEIVKCMRSCVLGPYPGSFPTPFLLSSSTFSQSWSMHSVHSVPKLERSTFVGHPQIVSS